MEIHILVKAVFCAFLMCNKYFSLFAPKIVNLVVAYR